MSVTEAPTLSDLLTLIAAGAADGHTDTVVAALRKRSRVAGAALAVPGTRVLTQNITPKRLDQRLGTVQAGRGRGQRIPVLLDGDVVALDLPPACLTAAPAGA